MPSSAPGQFIKHKGDHFVVVDAVPDTGGAKTVKVARISSTKPKNSARAVETKTWVKNYWVLLDHVKVVSAGELVDRCTSPWGLGRDQLAIVRKELGKIAG